LSLDHPSHTMLLLWCLTKSKFFDMMREKIKSHVDS
jgi:hypothetical protein